MPDERGAGSTWTTAWPSGVPRASGATTWELAVGRDVCNAKGLLFGGWMLGAFTRAGEELTTQTLGELRVSFVAGVAVGEALVVDASPLNVRGSFRHVLLGAKVNGHEVASGHAMLGPPPELEATTNPPVVPLPDVLPHRAPGTGVGSGSSRLLEIIQVTSDGEIRRSRRSRQWVRLLVDVDPTVALAVAIDLVPAVVKRSGFESAFIVTMSASLTIHRVPPVGWLLVEVEVVATSSLVAVGEVRVWSEQGVLVATASQTCRILSRRPGGER